MDRSRVNANPLSPASKQDSPGRSPSSAAPSTGMGATPVEPPGFEANRSDALAPGTKLEGYEIERVIGASGFGFVYLAYDPAAQRRVAIKEYLPDTLAVRDEDGMQVLVRADSHIEAFDRGRDAFIEEAQLLARCEHPSLLHVTRSWQAKGTAYRLMPYYPGNSLYSLREAMDSPADEASLRALLDGLFGALETLHDAGVTHREVSPWNILLLPDDTPILLDLSAARRAMVGDRARALMSLLTPSFAPIELMNPTPERPIGPWTDIHALGAVIRYCISGEMPRPATAALVREPMGAMVRRLQVMYPRLHYSASFLMAIDAALEANPEDRPQSIKELRKRLDDHPNVLMSRGDEEFEPMAAAEVDDESLMGPFDVRPEPEAAAANEPLADPIEIDDFDAPSSSEPFLSVLAPTPPAEARRFESASHGTGFEPDPRGHFDAHAERRPAAFEFAERTRRNRRRMAMGAAVLALAAIGAGAWWIDQQRNASAAQSAFEQAVKRDVGIKPADGGKPLEEVAQTVPVPATVQAASQGAAPTLPAEPTRAVETDGKPAVVPPPAPALATTVAAPPITMAPTGTHQAPTAAISAGTGSARATPSKNTVPHKAVKARPAAVATKPSAGPREVCGDRTEFSLYRCMKTQCAQAQWATHPSCKRLRERDEIG